MNRSVALRLGNAVILVVLAAALALAQAPKPAAKASMPAGNAPNGQRIYTRYGCYECHGREAQGSSATGPRLGPRPMPFEAFVGYVRHPAGDMPPYTSKTVSDSELADIHAFLESRPQPPAVNTIPLLK